MFFVDWGCGEQVGFRESRTREHLTTLFDDANSDRRPHNRAPCARAATRLTQISVTPSIAVLRQRGLRQRLRSDSFSLGSAKFSVSAISQMTRCTDSRARG